MTLRWLGPHTGARTADILPSGIVAGLLGGILMALWLMLAAAAAGDGLLRPLRLIGATFTGERGLQGGQAAIAGGLLHLVVAMAWGIAFAIVVRGVSSPGRMLGAAVAFAVGVFVVMHLLVAPVLNPLLIRGVSPLRWFVAHLVYGIGLAVAPALRRWFAAGRPPAEIAA